jgi:hypothetical protein
MNEEMDPYSSTSPQQHDDHIWLTAGGRAWAIYAMKGHELSLWRGYHPYIEWSYLDISRVNWESYHNKALKILFPNGGPLLEALTYPSPQDTQGVKL